ncbi:MAG: MerR family transcriptional regulator [Oscillospiraceae bacterium]|nr:MerR family transcriptional regulator [Oscillospiraceae bacterium]
MKVKDVLERTGLTDRAVRLYIANGLVAPECSRSYTGRNNYEFSEADVEVLKRIALLRKADFSIEQIKALQSGGEEAKKALSEYLDAKREEYHRDGLILEALSGLPEEEIPNLDQLCARLSESFREKQVPRADLKPTWTERLESIIFLTVSFLGTVLFLLVNLGLQLILGERFPFRKWTKLPGVWISWVWHLVALLPALLLLWVFLMYCRRRLVKKKRKRRFVISSIVVFLSVFLSLVGPMTTALYLTQMAPVIYSETDDPDNYMVLGTDMQISVDALLLMFPRIIPEGAYAEGSDWFSEDCYPETTRYYYRYSDFLAPDFDIFAQWMLPEDEFCREVQRVQGNLTNSEVYVRQWGNWTCLSLTEADFEEVNSFYYHHFFAYNEKTHMVRYIYSYCLDGGGEYASPYFLTLDWES